MKKETEILRQQNLPQLPRLAVDNLGFPVHAALVECGGVVLQEDYYAPCGPEQLHRMFSVTKSFCSLAVGALCASGKLSLDDKIVSFFPEYVKEPVHPWLTAMRVRDLLRMQTCHASTTYKLDMNSNWVESFFTTAPNHRPGQIFNYDTSASHTLAALVKKLSGQGVLDFLRPLCLDALGFSKDAYIILDPFGAEMGGSGLMARPRDLLAVMRLVMDLVNGRFFCRAAYKTLVSAQYDAAFWQRFAAYLREATSWQTPTLHSGQTVDEQQGYGYQFWMLRDGGCAMFGMGGQYAIMYPQHELLYVLTADTQNIKGGTQFLLNAVNTHMHTLFGVYACERIPGDSSPAASGIAVSKVAGNKPIAETSHPQTPEALQHEDATFPGAGRYALAENASGFTFVEIDSKMFRLRQRWGAIEFEYEFPYGFDKPKEGRTDKYQQRVYTTGSLQADGSLYLCAQILDEYVGSLHFLFRFTDGRLSLYMRKIEETYFKEFSGFFEGSRS